jgi:hypothetical protein
MLPRFFSFLFLFPLPLAGTFAVAQQHIQVKTKWDLYQLDQKGKSYFLSGKKVTSPHLDPLLTLLSTPATAPCPGKFQTQIEVRVSKPGQKTQINHLNLDKGILKGPQGCLMITGSGVDGFPLARSWLIGPFERTVKVLKTLSFSSKDENFTVEKKNGRWELSENNPTFNFEFLEQMLRSLQDFRVDRFIILKPSNTKEKVTMKVDGARLSFYQLAPTTWALREGEKPWAMVSSNWSSWKDLAPSQWTDSYAQEIKILLSASSSTKQREDQLEKLGLNWSESLKRAYQTCLLDESFGDRARSLCLQRMRRRPTQDNTQTVMTMIENTDGPELLREAANYLRIENPKGPRFSEKTDPEQFRSAWKSWWQKHSRP